jgi:hypothetical protein
VSSCFDGCWIAPTLENEVNRVLQKICKQLMKEPISLDVDELMKKKKKDDVTSTQQQQPPAAVPASAPTAVLPSAPLAGNVVSG